MGYKFSVFFAKLIMRLFTRLRVYGFENVPTSGSFVVASNHLGRLDPIMVYKILARKDIILLVAEKYNRSAIVRWFARQLDAIFVDRFGADFSAVRQALNRLRKGGVLVLAPEGTRSPTGSLIEGRPGVSFMANKARAPIIPVALMGTEDKLIVSNMKRFKRTDVEVRIGAPFTLPPINNAKERERVLNQQTDEIMCRIAALLRPEYRGVYADHPRLKELLSE